jgi:hypothetical protein
VHRYDGLTLRFGSATVPLLVGSSSVTTGPSGILDVQDDLARQFFRVGGACCSGAGAGQPGTCCARCQLRCVVDPPGLPA